jgi:hypothetical protein
VNVVWKFPNPNGVVASLASHQPQPRWGWLGFLRLTQGGSCLATLGFVPESLWDSVTNTDPGLWSMTRAEARAPAEIRDMAFVMGNKIFTANW